MFLILLAITSCDKTTAKTDDKDTASTEQITEPPCDHNYKSKTTISATCVSDGEKMFTCSKCNDSYTETIAATGKHSYNNKVTTPATYIKSGVKTYTCKTCTKSYTEQIPATGPQTYSKLKNHIVSKGTYSSKTKSYELELGYEYISGSSSEKYTRLAIYYCDEDVISLMFEVSDLAVATIMISEINDSYIWMYFDTNDHYIHGKVNTETFNKNTTLSYTDHNISDYSTRSTFLDLSAWMIDSLCSFMDNDFKSLGITAKDLGFLNY